MSQRIQDTDAFIMLEFAQAAAHLHGCPVDIALRKNMLAIATPFVDRLLRNGHSRFDAVDLLRAAWAVNAPALSGNQHH